MTRTLESKWQPLREFLEGYVQENVSYRAGAIYEAYLNECAGVAVSRKSFEMFLRYQVMQDDGILKRTAHGVYEMRTNPAEQDILFSRGIEKTNTEISLDEVLDECVELNMKLQTLFEKLNYLDNISFPAQMELGQLKTSALKNIDTVITAVSATMSWCEEHVNMTNPDENESMEMIRM